MKPRVVLWRAMYHPDGHQMLADGGADVIVIESSNPDEVKQALHGARALWVRTPEREKHVWRAARYILAFAEVTLRFNNGSPSAA